MLAFGGGFLDILGQVQERLLEPGLYGQPSFGGAYIGKKMFLGLGRAGGGAEAKGENENTDSKSNGHGLILYIHTY